MDNENLLQAVKEKISKLLRSGVAVEYLPNEAHRIQQIKLDHLVFCKDRITGGDGDKWVPMVVVDFIQNPILQGKQAQACLDELLEGQGGLLEMYLNN